MKWNPCRTQNRIFATGAAQGTAWVPEKDKVIAGINRETLLSGIHKEPDTDLMKQQIIV